jgi:glycosyltransferase domain-containing protein
MKIKDMNLEEVTIVILSRDRNEVLAKTLIYWSNFNISVLILHNSNTPLPLKKIPTNSRYYNLNVNYGERAGHAAQLIETPYAIMSSDDEVFLPSAIFSAVKLLNNDSELVSVGGQTLAVGKYESEYNMTIPYKFNSDYRNFGNSAAERLFTHFTGPTGYRNGSLYRVIRSSTLKQVLIEFSQLGAIPTPYIYEATSEILINGLGKSYYIKDLIWIRNWLNVPIQNNQWQRNKYFFQWVESDKVEFEIWKNRLNSFLCIKPERFNELIDIFKNIRASSELNEISKNRKLRGRIPKKMRYLITRVLRRKIRLVRLEGAVKNLKQHKLLFELSELKLAIGYLTENSVYLTDSD